MNDTKKICEVGGSGIVLPLGGDAEQRWPRGLRIILYGLGLFWCFLGVAIIADVFMGAIECITAKKTRKQNPKTGRWVTAHIWNPTVANLTLMALGSSAPEILLSLIELYGNDWYSGPLGPSTIVGSAAFNLLCIIAVCVFAIPDGEVRRIKEMPVYVVTASFSIFAYVWMLVIIQWNSENVVEPWEGIVTFLFFPVLVVIAFLADRGYFSKASPDEDEFVLSAEMTKDELAELDMRIRKQYGENLTWEQVSKIALVESNDHKSRAQYRVAATRALTGGKRVRLGTTLADTARSMTGPLGDALKYTRRLSGLALNKVAPEEALPNEQETGKNCTVIEFATASYAVLENAGSVKTTVMRSGDLANTYTVRYATRSGMAKAEEDYVHVEGMLTFGPTETQKEIEVKIVNDVAYEDDEDFFIDLCEPTTTGEDIVQLGKNQSATVVIIDDDLPGFLGFPKETMSVPEAVRDHEVEIQVLRTGGCCGRVTCKYATESSGAMANLDFDPTEGELVFEDNETSATIKVMIRAKGRYESTEDFRVVLSDATGGARFDKETDGGAESAILTIFIVSDDKEKDRVDRLLSSLAVNWDKAKVGHNNWKDQFIDAIFVNGGDDGDDGEPPSKQDWILHIISMPWKLLFAFVPPTDYCGGWVCFVCALLMIGVVTMVIGDLASLFGCVCSFPDEIAAITVVALGTSLPDTFASKTAAVMMAHADASIGNVTGSNSVNVFLGLGLPWMLAALIWRSGDPGQEWKERYLNDADVPSKFRDGEHGVFVVKAGSLAFSVAVFCGCAVTCIATLLVRRRFCNGELGGPRKAKLLTSAGLVGLWLLYVILSALKALLWT